MVFPATPEYVMAGNSAESILIYWGQPQLGKPRPFAVQLNRLPDANGLGSEQYATRRVERTSVGLWAMRGSRRRIFFGGSGPPPYPEDMDNHGGTRMLPNEV